MDLEEKGSKDLNVKRRKKTLVFSIVIPSFNSQNLVDELYIYTANNKVIKSNFKTPIDISSNWRLKTTKALGDDELQVFEREEMCLQE